MLRIKSLCMTLLCMAALLAGCASTQAHTTISIVGSSSVEPLMTILTDQYQALHPEIAFDVQATGSSAGIKSARNGSTDIGMSSRELAPEEASSDMAEDTLALDGIAIVVHRENPIDQLTQQQVTDIYNGTIRNWSELGGADRPIVLLSREAGSGTRDAFEGLLGLLVNHYSTIAEDAAIYCDSTNSIAQNVADKTNAIGYVSLGSLGTDIKALRIDGVSCNEENIQNGAYPLARPFLLLIHPNDEERSAVLADFLAFTKSPEGQRSIWEEGFVPVP